MRYASDMSSRRLPAADGALIRIVDAALADAARRSGEWLVCRPGCTQCCVGVFAINQLDALRLRQGLAELEQTDAARAGRIRARARDSIQRLSAASPAKRVSRTSNREPAGMWRMAVPLHGCRKAATTCGYVGAPS